MPELNWLTRDIDLTAADRVPYRLLEEVSELSATDSDPSTENMLIRGDNLDALKALLPIYAGQVKCIFIDPPYNTRSAFEHYDDNLEHSQWLAMMYPRLTLLSEFLRKDGSIWVTIDDNEAHYLKVVMDEVFGRKNFVANVLWQKRTSPDARIQLGAAHDHLFVYAKSRGTAKFNKLKITDGRSSEYKNPDNDPRGPWASTDFTAQGWRPNQMYRIVTPGGKEYDPPPGRCWSNIESEYKKLLADSRMWFGNSRNSRPRVKTFLSESEGVSSWTWWTNEEVGNNQESKKEIIALFGADDTFATPKPERLIRRALQIASDADELVLDSFLGSGTTAAVAHKMNRRYIGIEMGEHAETHCIPRLRKVINGEQGGISGDVGWQGGGGFRFYRLGRPIFNADGMIDPAIRFPQLAAHVWFTETKTPKPRPRRGETRSPCLGVHNGTAYYLLYNGILGDRHPQHGNVLTRAILAELTPHDGPRIVYGESCRLSATTLARLGITFKQTPYDVRAR